MSVIGLLNKLSLHTMSLESRGTGSSDIGWEDVSAALAGLPDAVYDFALAIYKHDNIATKSLLQWLTDWLSNYFKQQGITPKKSNCAQSIAFIAIYQHIVKSRRCTCCKGLGFTLTHKQCTFCNGLGYHGASTEDKLKLGQLSITRQCYERKYQAIEQLATSELLNFDNILIEHLTKQLFPKNKLENAA